jgi:hypothetical protein
MDMCFGAAIPAARADLSSVIPWIAGFIFCGETVFPFFCRANAVESNIFVLSPHIDTVSQTYRSDAVQEPLIE